MEAKASTDETEFSERVETTADALREALSGWDVTVSPPSGSKEQVQFTAYRKDVGTNGYAKGTVINTVLREVPSLEVDTVRDGDMAVSFVYVNP